MNARYGLILDIDGVIADTEPVNAAATIDVLSRMFGVEGLTRSDFVAGVGCGGLAYVRAGAGLHGLELSDEDADRVVAARESRIVELIRSDGLARFPGVLELALAALAREEFSVSIATSGDRQKAEIILDAVGMPRDRIRMVTGDDVARKKPAPDLFLSAANGMGLDPASCAVVEDAPSGVAAAEAAGCRCIAVANSVAPELLQNADRIVDSLAEIGLTEIVTLVG